MFCLNSAHLFQIVGFRMMVNWVFVCAESADSLAGTPV